MTQTEALKLALEALEVANSLVDGYYLPKEKAWLPEIEEAITAIKAVLKANDEPVVWNEGVPAMLPKQKEGETFIVSYEPKLEAKDEPVAWIDKMVIDVPNQILYTAPQRTWVGLTDEDIEQEFGFIDELLRDCVQRTEAKLKEKNQ